MVPSLDLTSGNHEPIGVGNEDEDEDESAGDVGGFTRLQGDEGGIIFRTGPERLPDGSEAALFYCKKDESMLSSKLVLFGGYQGIATFEDMLPEDYFENEATSDFSFVRFYE